MKVEKPYPHGKRELSWKGWLPLLLFLMILCTPKRAYGNFVSAGSASSASALSTSCVPNNSGVTVGDLEVMVAWGNIVTYTGISSTRVNHWISDKVGLGLAYWHGTATSSGSESITVTIASTIGTHLSSVCAEYTLNVLDAVNAPSNNVASVTTTAAVTDLVVGASDNGTPAGAGVASPFTTRAFVDDGVGQHRLVLADVGETSIGTYTATASGVFPGIVLAAFRASAPPPIVTTPVLAGPSALPGPNGPTIQYPNGSFVNGRLLLKLERSGLVNTCTTSTQVASTANVIVQIVNGALQSNLSPIPTDCLSQFQPYLVELRDAKNIPLFRSHWFIAPGGGVALSPGVGSFIASPTGLASITGSTAGQTINSPLSLLVNWPGGYQTAKISTGSISGLGYKSVTVTWPKPFQDTLYTVFCDVLASSAPAGSNMSVSSVDTETMENVSVSVTNNSSGTLSGTVTCRGREP